MKVKTTNTSSTRRPRQTIKNKTKSPQVAAEEHGIVNVFSEDTHWLKKTIIFKVEETRS
jgi:hypothetical protein